jgi:hypothetical protein
MAMKMNSPIRRLTVDLARLRATRVSLAVDIVV